MRGMSSENYQMYKQGRTARAIGRPVEAGAEVLCPVKRSFWLAGWHDADIEALAEAKGRESVA